MDATPTSGGVPGGDATPASGGLTSGTDAAPPSGTDTAPPSGSDAAPPSGSDVAPPSGGAAGVDAALARAWVAAVAASVTAHAAELTDLDAAIGDGDHGVNLRRGFDAVVAALATLEADTAGAVLTKTGTTLVSKVGGASGPLYGSLFRALGKTLSDDSSVTTFGAGLRAGLDAIVRLGKAEPGDKTMVDALTPAVAAFEAATSSGLVAAATAAATAAADGAAATTPLQARKGRASYLGERSVGHQDPGATSTALIFAALADVT
ncbi:dihydroxyacetone kinase subunit DhaL [Dactylosporangium sp. NPDC006015]|uniref:dihydroxyacetone kinase subunit DhaL n=1 Tax=Dactylosporangium sp. NPDC006015 TaxID=3154576 RepID=UPI0033AC3809